MLRILLSLALVLAHAEKPQPPAGWSAFLKFDREFNVATRDPVELSERDIVKVWHVDVPADKVETVESQFLDEGMKKRVFIEKGGEKFVRFFFVEHPRSAEQLKTLEALKGMGYQAEQKLWGAFVQSHSTFFVWDPEKPDGDPFFMKARFLDGDYNGFEAAKIAVNQNDIVEKVLHEANDPMLRMFPERFGAQLKDLKLEYSYSLRSAQASGPPVDKDVRLIPLHGLLGSDRLIAAYAKKMNLTPREWIEREYLSKLAKFSARAQYKHGLYFVAHSQNLLVNVNQRTGEIDSFVARDMTDVLFDAYARLRQGRPSHVESGWVSAIHDFFIDNPLAVESGWHQAIYLMQSVASNEKGTKNFGPDAVRFLLYLAEEAERELGHSIRLSPEGQDALKELEKMDGTEAPTFRQKLAHWWEGKKLVRKGNSRSRAQIWFARVAQDIYEQMLDHSQPLVWPEHLAYDRASLRKLFDEKIEGERVAMLRPGAKKRLEGRRFGLDYGFDGRGIYVFERKTGDMIAYAFDLTKEEIGRLAPGVPTMPPFCDWHWKRVRKFAGWERFPLNLD